MEGQMIFDEIAEERKRQDDKWGTQSHEPIEWLPILMEEVGEVAREVCENHFPVYGKSDMSNYRKELIQVAAVVVHMIENLDATE
jgi:NTP pyrophosphatase (non-canonical NTP hydrolase)